MTCLQHSSKVMRWQRVRAFVNSWPDVRLNRHGARLGDLSLGTSPAEANAAEKVNSGRALGTNFDQQTTIGVRDFSLERGW